MSSGPVSFDGFPRVSVYLGLLPEGVASFPECRGKASAFAPAARAVGGRVPRGALPPPVERVLRGEFTVTDWMPEVVGHCVTLAYADLAGLDDAGILRFSRNVATELVSSPLYRALFAVASPRLLLKGAAGRFAAFHRGYELSFIDGGASHALLRLDHPAHLIPPVLQRGILESVSVPLTLAGGRQVHAQTTSQGPEHAVVRVDWA